MIPRPLSLRSGRILGLVPYTDVLQGYRDVVATCYGWTGRQARRKALLAMAHLLEEDLTTTYVP